MVRSLLAWLLKLADIVPVASCTPFTYNFLTVAEANTPTIWYRWPATRVVVQRVSLSGLPFCPPTMDALLPLSLIAKYLSLSLFLAISTIVRDPTTVDGLTHADIVNGNAVTRSVVVSAYCVVQL